MSFHSFMITSLCIYSEVSKIKYRKTNVKVFNWSSKFFLERRSSYFVCILVILHISLQDSKNIKHGIMNGEAYPETHSSSPISSLNMSGVDTDTVVKQSSKLTEFFTTC